MFSISSSAAATFKVCRRRFFWEKYWQWGGWRRNVGGSRRLAYALKKAVNPWSVAGHVVHETAARLAQDVSQGGALPGGIALQLYATGQYDAVLGRAHGVRWDQASKRNPLLLAQFYGEDDEELSKVHELARKRVEVCVANLVESEHLTRMAEEVKAGRPTLVWSETPARFPLVVDDDKVDVWVVPDLAYRRYEPQLQIQHLVIVDWKTGKEKADDLAQLALYGAWAVLAGETESEDVVLVADYLLKGETRARTLEDGEVESTLEDLRDTVREIRKLLVDEDLGRNEPIIAAEAWPQLDEYDPECRRCDFKRLCRRG